MRTKKIEKKLADEIRAETPDALDNILARCTPEENPATVPVMAAGKSRKWVKAVYAAAAMLVLFIGGYLGIGQYRAAYAAEYAVTLDAGASVRLEVSKTGKVVSAAGLDAKGEAAIAASQTDETLKGRKLDAAVAAVVSAMADSGGVSGQGAILVTVDGPDETENAAAKAQVTAAVSSTLKKQGIKAAVLGQIAGADKAITALAEKYGVSEGKAALIKKAAESDSNLDKTELSKLDIGALGVLAQNRKAEASASISVTGDSGANGYVSADAAAKSACAKANVSWGNAASAEVATEVSEGKLVYRVTVKAGTSEATCEVDAKTGAILNWVSSVAAGAVGGSASPAPSTGTDASGGATNGATPAPSVSTDASINVDPGTDINGQSILDRVHSDVQTVIDSLQQRIQSGLNQTN